MKKIFLTLTGPSGVGKSPLQKAVNRFSKGLLEARPVLCHSRPPRVGEVHGQDYYFLPPTLIKALGENGEFLVAPVRTDWQAIDLGQVADLLRDHDLVFAELFYTFVPHLCHHAIEMGFKTFSVFLMPVELDPYNETQAIVEVMRKKLERRGTDLAKIEERAQWAPIEMQAADQFTHRLLNLAGEDEVEEWGEFGMRNGIKGEKTIQKIEDLGPNAAWSVNTFVEIAAGRLPPGDYRR